MRAYDIIAIVWAWSAAAAPCAFAAGKAVPLADWEFSRGARGEAWERVAVPHDWAIAGPFDREIDRQTVAIVQNGEKTPTEKTGRSGALPWIGEGRYRRTVEIPGDAAFASLVFEGAMSEPEIFWDGEKIGEWKYGYSAFEVEIPREKMHGRHELEVRLSNVAESSRWYPGAGLYRPVLLVTGGEALFAHFGIDVKTALLPDGSARVTASAEVRGDAAGAEIEYELLLADDGIAPLRSKSGEFTLAHPRLWSPENPSLYTLVATLRKDGRTLERRETKVGLRTVAVDREGFKLNGEVRKIKGVCLHHDLGPLGAAFSEAAFRRQLRKLKDIGCDAVRFAHNMPSPGQLAICDEMGMMAMAESFDCWQRPKCANGYNRFYAGWWRRDLENLVKICRAHPCVVMYSIGNEIPEQSRTEGREMSREMQAFVHNLDPSLPVTQGLDQWPGALKSRVAAEMDVCGLNYRLPYYTNALAVAKNGVVLGSETASTFSSRGCYYFPVEEKAANRPPRADGQCSSYDVEYASWSNLPDDDRAMQEDRPDVIGEFVWTGFDYLGEPSPYDEYWPSRSSYFGIFDLAGLPKDRAFLYRSYWRKDAPTLHILPHWTWPGREGETTPVYVYTDADSAELFVNGISQGVRTKAIGSRVTAKGIEGASLDRYRLRWNDVRYEPGELKVVTADGREARVRTAGEPAAIKIEAEPSDGRDDLVFFDVSIIDAKGDLCPEAAIALSFEVAGAAVFKGVCNGDATSLEIFTAPRMTTFKGRLAVVVERKGEGVATLSARGGGMEGGIDFTSTLPK